MGELLKIPSMKEPVIDDRIALGPTHGNFHTPMALAPAIVSCISPLPPPAHLGAASMEASQPDRVLYLTRKPGRYQRRIDLTGVSGRIVSCISPGSGSEALFLALQAL